MGISPPPHGLLHGGLGLLQVGAALLQHGHLSDEGLVDGIFKEIRLDALAPLLQVALGQDGKTKSVPSSTAVTPLPHRGNLQRLGLAVKLLAHRGLVLAQQLQLAVNVGHRRSQLRLVRGNVVQPAIQLVLCGEEEKRGED